VAVAVKKKKMNKPKGAEYYVDGSYYKYGFHNVVYRHNGNEWVSSTRDIEEIKREDRKQNK
jgi:hypothetical protein